MTVANPRCSILDTRYSIHPPLTNQLEDLCFRRIEHRASSIEHPPLAAFATQPGEKIGSIAGLLGLSTKQSWCDDQCNPEESERDE